MNFNATLFGQMIAFAFFTWFCAKYVWPYLINKIDERQTKIADGLAAGEKGRRELELAEQKVADILSEGKGKALEFINQAQKRHDEIVESSKDNARKEGERILSLARDEIDQERQQARAGLRSELSALVIVAAEKVLMREVDQSAHEQVLDQISTRLTS